MTRNKNHRGRRGMTLIEVLAVIGLIGLLVGGTMLSFGSMWGNLRFEQQADELVNVFKMAYNAATETDRRYAVILDFSEQAYILREFKTLDLETMDPDEAIIQSRYLGERMELYYVQYDDGKDTRDSDNVTEARFLAGRSGWQYGGLVVLLDEEGQPWTLVVRRFARPVEIFEGEWDLESLGMGPQDEQNVPF